MLIQSYTRQLFAAALGVLLLFGASPALAKAGGCDVSPCTSTPDPTTANILQTLTGIAIEDDIYLDAAGNLHNNPNNYEGEFQAGIHYLRTNDGQSNAGINEALSKLKVEVYVFGDGNSGAIDPQTFLDEDGDPLNINSGKVGFVFRNLADGSGSDPLHIKDIYFDDPTHTDIINGNPVFNDDFLSNMKFWTDDAVTTPGLENKGTLSEAPDNATNDGTYKNGQGPFPHWDPFNEGSNRPFDADFAAHRNNGHFINAEESLGLIFDYDHNSGLGAFAAKVNAVRFGFHVGGMGMNDDESIKLWVEMPLFETPEPSTWALLSTGLVGLIGYSRRRKKTS